MAQELWVKYPLLNTMSKLRASRFNAAERLAKRYRWHSIALVVFSIYVIALSIAPNFFPNMRDDVRNVTGFVSIVSSVFVVALSVYSAFSEDVVRGKYLHDNAKRVTNLYQQYKIMAYEHVNNNGPAPSNSEFESKYAAIMDSCPYNHDGIDFQNAMIGIEKIHPSDAKRIKFKLAFDMYFWPILAILLPPIAIGFGLLFFGSSVS